MNIGLIDDHQLVRDGFKHLIETQDGLNIVAEASCFEEAVEFLNQVEIDLAIIDISLPNINGIELLKYCKKHFPHIKTLMVSMYDQYHYVSSATTEGCDGYISKRSAADSLLTAISAIQKGNRYFGHDIMTQFIPKESPSEPMGVEALTQREAEVFVYLSKGLNPKSIARILDIMPKTVHTHKQSIHKKLNTSNNFELLKIALNSGMILIEELSLSNEY